jgi:3-deoxy-7-phosphoheptulonate synthase
VVDPSHSAGRWALVAPLAKAAVAGGSDGLLVEVHSKPEEALCDGPQAMLPEKFSKLMKEVRKISKALGREM